MRDFLVAGNWKMNGSSAANAELVDGILADVMATRQVSRRKVLLAQLDVFDTVKGRFYHWLTSQDDYRE